jgi:decaprenyl-phosphate phosphoribosyltransferase
VAQIRPAFGADEDPDLDVELDAAADPDFDADLAIDLRDAVTHRTPRKLPRALVSQARPRQWVKNVLVFAAPGAAGVVTHGDVAPRVAVAFAAFCLVASGVYYVNDVLDVEADRAHPSKRHRPIAAGELSIPFALVVGIALFGGGIGLAATLGWRFLVAIGVYVALTTAYSVRLKHVAVVDLTMVAAGFVVRAVSGGVAADVPISRWFLIVASFGSLFMVAGKRYSEFVHLGDERVEVRAAMEDYTVGFLRYVWMAASVVTMSAYCLWAFEQSDHPGVDPAAPLVAHPIWYQLSIIPFVLALLRYALLVDAGHGAAPEEVVQSDRALQVLGVVWVAVFAIGVYAGR